MLDLQLNLQEKTAARFLKILNLYTDQEKFAQNIIDYQVQELKRGIFNLELDIKAFEKKYQLSSDEFYKKFSNGKIDDREDYLLWAGQCELLQENKEQLQGLE